MNTHLSKLRKKLGSRAFLPLYLIDSPKLIREEPYRIENTQKIKNKNRIENRIQNEANWISVKL